MNFNKHYEFDENDHAFLSPSRHHWINYDTDKLVQAFTNWQAAKVGTRIHAWAKETILLGIKQAKSNKTVNMFINDAIGYRMTPEQILVYSSLCFGTADAICFDERHNILRIHDLKTGVTKAHMEQLELYAALFCLEYEKNPNDIEIELRIYQNDEIEVHIPVYDPELGKHPIEFLMDEIVIKDRYLSEIK